MPRSSTFWNISYHVGNATVVNENSLCIFEADMNFPVSRHRSAASDEYGFSNLGTIKGSALVVRAIATIGNYDYMFDYSSHMDASLEVTVRASGYSHLSTIPTKGNGDQESSKPPKAHGTIISLPRKATLTSPEPATPSKSLSSRSSMSPSPGLQNSENSSEWN